MNVTTVINAKGGCGKSTIALNLAAALGRTRAKVLLIDLDPQAQLSEWLSVGDGLSPEGTIAAVFQGRENMADVIHSTPLKNVSFVASAEPLEDLGHRIIARRKYEMLLTRALQSLDTDFDYVVIDSPNQISPIMRNAIYPADLFVIPFDDTKAVKSYANVYRLIESLRPEHDFHRLHVLNRQLTPGQRKRTVEAMEQDGIEIARIEIRSCAYLAQSDEHAGRSIFDFRRSSKGARDIAALRRQVVALFKSTVEVSV